MNANDIYFYYTHTDSSIISIGDFIFAPGSVVKELDIEKFVSYRDENGISNIRNIFEKYSQEEYLKYEDLLHKYEDFTFDVLQIVDVTGTTAKELESIPFKLTTKVAIPFSDFDRSQLSTVSNEVMGWDTNAFISDALKNLYNDPKYRNVYSKQDIAKGKVKDIYANASVWVWSRTLSSVLVNNELGFNDVIIDITPFVTNLSVSNSKQGGTFKFDVVPVIATFENGHWVLDKNIKGSETNYVSNTPIYKSVKDTTRSQFFLHNIIHENSIVFIRNETLMSEKQRLFGTRSFIVDKKDLQNKVFDMIGLVDQNIESIDPQNNDITIRINGRNHMKLLIDDGIYFYPSDYVDGGIFANERDDERLERFDGQLISRFHKDYQTIQSMLSFLFNALGTIRVCSDTLFDAYQNQGGVTDRRTYRYKENGIPKYGNEKAPLKGIWQIIKTIVDNSVQNRRVVDGTIGNEMGSIINAVNKICVDPFVEFFADTYGDQNYFIVRKPPFDRQGYIGLLKGRILNEQGKEDFCSPILLEVEDSDIINQSLSYGSKAFSWYNLTPQGDFEGGTQIKFALGFKAVFFKEYADIFGSCPLDIITNYITYFQQLDKDSLLRESYLIKQGILDLKFMVESNQYNPFTRTGTITILPDRRIKIGTLIRLTGTREIFYVDSVEHTTVIDNDYFDKVTILGVSHGMIEKYIDNPDISYFNIIETPVDEQLFRQTDTQNTKRIADTVISKWKVNKRVFDFFLRAEQFA